MSKKVKKGLLVSGLVIDAIVTIFLFVIALILIIRSNKMDRFDIEHSTETGLLIYLQRNPNVYLLGFVVPLFILLAINIVALVMYVKKSDKKDVTVSDLTEEQKELLKKQLMDELNKK